VCILIAWEKSIMKESKKNWGEKSQTYRHCIPVADGIVFNWEIPIENNAICWTTAMPIPVLSRSFFSSFLFCTRKKLWFLNCPPNFLGSMSYCITNYYDYSYTMINPQRLPQFQNYKSRWTIRSKDECWKIITNWTKKIQVP